MIIRSFIIATTVVALSGCASMQTSGSSGSNSKPVTVEQTERGVEIRASSAVFFDTGMSNIKPSANELLDNIANILKNDTKNKSIVEGHADAAGPENINKTLSEVRALTVMKALVDRGVPVNRISHAGYGSSKPIASNQTAEGRQLNRRTNVLIVGEKKENLNKSFAFMDSINNKLASLLDILRRD